MDTTIAVDPDQVVFLGLDTPATVPNWGPSRPPWPGSVDQHDAQLRDRRGVVLSIGIPSELLRQWLGEHSRGGV